MFLGRSLFFEALKSKSRLKLCKEINCAVYTGIMKKDCTEDPFSQCPELDDYDIFAGDGHYHAATAGLGSIFGHTVIDSENLRKEWWAT